MTPTPYDAYELAKQIGETLTDVHKRYAPCYGEGYYSSGKGDDSTFRAVVSEAKERKRQACANAYKDLQTALRSLKAAQAKLSKAWTEPVAVGECWHCLEAQGLSQYGGLCQSDYMFQYRNGYLPTDETLAKRYGWDES